LRGAIYAMPVSSVVLVAAYALLVGRDRTARQVLHSLSVSVAQLPSLFTYSAMMFATIALTNIGLTFTRAKLLVDAGAQANGYLQTATAISAYILTFVTTGFWGHVHARAAAAGDTPEIRAELGKALRLAMLVSFTGCGTAAMLARYLIPLFYSGQFGPAEALMIAYMPGELCYQLLFLLTAYQLTVSRRRRYFSWSLGYVVLLVSIGYLAIPRFGAPGYVGAHVSSALVMVCVAAAVCLRSGQIRLPFLFLAATLLGLLSLMSAGSFYLIGHPQAEAWRMIGLVPVAATAAIAGRALLRGMFPLARAIR
jgi:O-antigen/teichoic acid export membrane protein